MPGRGMTRRGRRPAACRRECRMRLSISSRFGGWIPLLPQSAAPGRRSRVGRRTRPGMRARRGAPELSVQLRTMWSISARAPSPDSEVVTVAHADLRRRAGRLRSGLRTPRQGHAAGWGSSWRRATRRAWRAASGRGSGRRLGPRSMRRAAAAGRAWRRTGRGYGPGATGTHPADAAGAGGGGDGRGRSCSGWRRADRKCRDWLRAARRGAFRPVARPFGAFRALPRCVDGNGSGMPGVAQPPGFSVPKA